MTQLRELYHCKVCGNVAEIASVGAPALVCCGQPMDKLQAKAEDAGSEKHVPVIEETSTGVKVKIGSVPHPMEEKHYIEFIEVLTKDKIMRIELKPGQAPEGESCVSKEDITTVREYCNVHGLWKSE